MCPDRQVNQQPFNAQKVLNQLSHTARAVIYFLKRMHTWLKHQNYTLCHPPHPADFVFLKGKGTLSWLRPRCLEPRMSPCPLVLGPKKTGVDLKYPGVYWKAGLSAPRSELTKGKAPLPCLPKQNDTLDITELVNTELLERLDSMNWTHDHIH